MERPDDSGATGLSGRVTAGPDDLLHEEVLAPQFSYELTHLLPHYILIEKVLLLEYERLGLMSRDEALRVGAALGGITAEALVADPQANMSDMAFAIERLVIRTIGEPPPPWHVDRSRNDLQACAQAMAGRVQVLDIASGVECLARVVLRRAEGSAELPLPGYTHYQSAQVISPGFYLAAVSDRLIQALADLERVLEEVDQCPLGAGAMAGQELDWNRVRMAGLLGFSRPRAHALAAVASRDWALRLAAELSLLGCGLSRFVTDLIHWAGSDCRFIELPDELSGISSAMPQKKNYPVLERIRGRTAHLTAYYVDFVLGGRNTPFSNLVEVSKESTVNLMSLCRTARSVLHLLTAVVGRLEFREERLRQVCEGQFLGGFSLANQLTILAGVPYRRAQVLAGRFILEAVRRGLGPRQVDAALLEEVCRLHGSEVRLPEDALRRALDPSANLRARNSEGGTAPGAVRRLLDSQRKRLEQLSGQWAGQRRRVRRAADRVDELLSAGDGGAGEG